MRRIVSSTAVGLLGFLFLTPRLTAQDIEPEDLKPGLIATYRDGATPSKEVVRLEPTIALHLSDGEAPHPRLNATGGTYRWSGHINILRNGSYRFDVRLRGKLSVKVGGKEVFTGESSAAEATLIKGTALTLTSGILPIEAEFTRPAGVARVELLWQIPQIPLEPLPFQVLGHLPKSRPATLQAETLREHGRYLVEERGCLQCHRPTADDKMAKGLISRQGPNLSGIGGRAYSGWLDAWLADPQKMRPTTGMPKMFSDDEDGANERYAVVRYLSTLGGTLEPFKALSNPKEVATSGMRGKSLFTTTGCIACHQDGPKESAKENSSIYGLLAKTGAQHFYPLGAVGSKTRSDRLAPYLQNPHTTSPNGRMPNMNLQGQEAMDLANFLCQNTDPKITSIQAKRSDAPPKELVKAVFEQLQAKPQESANLEKLPVDLQWAEVGKRLVTTKGCVNCHSMTTGATIAPSPIANKPLAEIRKDPKAGCLAETPAKAVPQFALSAIDRDGLKAFLSEGLEGSGSPASAYSARIAFKRFGCLNCHQRESEGGIATEIADQMKKLEKSENVDEVRPPILTDVGHKLRTPWLKAVLTVGAKARPWMSLRMPQYGDGNVGFLDEALAKLDGAAPDSTIHQVELTPEKVQAGRQIVGKNGLGCISCHDIAGIPNTGTRGPDMATTNQRVRYDWFRRWLEVPLRMAPGTRMPQVFIDGKSTLQGVLGGHGDAQSEAMWAYLSLGPNLPLPIGLEPPKGLVIRVDKEPEILRTFMPESGNRGIAVGYPGNINLAFDANTCRLAYAWTGSFIDASPVWNNRGGAPAKILGSKFWSSPTGNPWAVTGSVQPPNFVARANDPAYGASLPDLKLFTGKPQVHFEGYALDPTGKPTFRYRVDGESSSTLNISETPEPINSSIASGFLRKFSVREATGEGTWFRAGESNKEPKVYSIQGEPQTIDLKAETIEFTTADRLIVLPQDGDRAVVISAQGLPADARWRLAPRQGGAWDIFIRFPPIKGGLKNDFSIATWSVGRVDSAMLKALNAK